MLNRGIIITLKLSDVLILGGAAIIIAKLHSLYKEARKKNED